MRPPAMAISVARTSPENTLTRPALRRRRSAGRSPRAAARRWGSSIDRGYIVRKRSCTRQAAARQPGLAALAAQGLLTFRGKSVDLMRFRQRQLRREADDAKPRISLRRPGYRKSWPNPIHLSVSAWRAW